MVCAMTGAGAGAGLGLRLFNGTSHWHGLAFPVMTLFFLYIPMACHGVYPGKGRYYWRGTSYAVDELKINRV
jgi:hypothetical protein